MSNISLILLTLGSLAFEIHSARAADTPSDRLKEGVSDSGGVNRDDLGRRNTTKNCTDNCRIFYVNYVVLTNDYFTDAATLRSEAELHVEWLNQEFRTRRGYQLFQFRYYGYSTSFNTALITDCPKLRQLGDGDHMFENTEFYEALGECYATNNASARKLFAKDAINVYVYDAHSGESGGESDMTGRGGWASGTAYGFASGARWPYVFLDYKRFSSTSTSANSSAAQEHEMGHAFGLGHLCIAGASSSSDTTPIMATGNDYTNSAGASVNCEYSGGDRSLGFTRSVTGHNQSTMDEIATIRERGEEYSELLGSPEPGSAPQW